MSQVAHPLQQQRREETVAEYWRKVEDEAVVQQVARSEDAAKQLIGLVGALQGLYLAIFAFSDLRKQISTLPIPLLVWLLFLLPILLWLISMYCATKVFVPVPRAGTAINNREEHAWQQTKQAYEQAAKDKQSWLRRSHRVLIAASCITILLIFAAFLFLPAVPELGPTQIIIVTPTPSIQVTP